MSYKRNSGYTLGSIYTIEEEPAGANNGQLSELNPFLGGTKLFCIETLVEYMH